eukprot:CAMPEP_0119308846 /NCGR_PEP_ID=MMETSP1333-20130426/12804_1 /TAXON_ID=418940 /ORGANISM="Scyphosphaera apsteinii, Strain RCC1455" /LENGTH=419 /DNA_ID=CAMNT_0007312711 /DNA_START=141 /DNA_END=1400 /DNA_ORIENTATION=-
MEVPSCLQSLELDSLQQNKLNKLVITIVDTETGRHLTVGQELQLPETVPVRALRSAAAEVMREMAQCTAEISCAHAPPTPPLDKAAGEEELKNRLEPPVDCNNTQVRRYRSRASRCRRLPPPVFHFKWKQACTTAQPALLSTPTGAANRSSARARRTMHRAAMRVATESMLDIVLASAIARAVDERAQATAVVCLQSAVRCSLAKLQLRKLRAEHKRAVIKLQATARGMLAVVRVHNMRIDWDEWAADNIATCECGSDANIRCFCGCVLCRYCHSIEGSKCPGSDGAPGCGADSMLTIDTHVRKLAAAWDYLEGASEYSLSDYESDDDSSDASSECDFNEYDCIVCDWKLKGEAQGAARKRKRYARARRHRPRARELARQEVMEQARAEQQLQKHFRSSARASKFGWEQPAIIRCFKRS